LSFPGFAVGTENLSIVIPTKNEEELLPKLLDSIKCQGYQAKETIVADAFSTDRTRQIASEYGCRVIDGGPLARGRNNGARASRSDLILFVDADIQLPESFLESALEEFRRRNLDVAGTLQTPAPTGGRLRDLMCSFFYGTANYWMRFTQRTPRPYMQVCMFSKKTIHERIGGFDETLIFGEDSEYAVRARRIGRFGILERTARVALSPRRFQADGLSLAVKYSCFNIARLLGREFRKQGRLVSYDYDYK